MLELIKTQDREGKEVSSVSPSMKTKANKTILSEIKQESVSYLYVFVFSSGREGAEVST